MSVLLAGDPGNPEIWFETETPTPCDVCGHVSFMCLLADGSSGAHAATAVCIHCVLDGVVKVSDVLDNVSMRRDLTATWVRQKPEQL